MAELKSDNLLEMMKFHLGTDAGKELTKKIGLVYQLNIAPKVHPFHFFFALLFYDLYTINRSKSLSDNFYDSIRIRSYDVNMKINTFHQWVKWVVVVVFLNSTCFHLWISEIGGWWGYLHCWSQERRCYQRLALSPNIFQVRSWVWFGCDFWVLDFYSTVRIRLVRLKSYGISVQVDWIKIDCWTCL